MKVHTGPYGPLAKKMQKALSSISYPMKQASALSGVDVNRIHQWIFRNQFKTKHVPAGSGHPRYFSLGEVMDLATLQMLSDKGVPMELAIEAQSFLSMVMSLHIDAVIVNLERGVDMEEEPKAWLCIDDLGEQIGCCADLEGAARWIGKLKADSARVIKFNDHFKRLETLFFAEIMKVVDGVAVRVN